MCSCNYRATHLQDEYWPADRTSYTYSHDQGFWEIFTMVSRCLENNRTDPLTYICRWIHEGSDLWWYMWRYVLSGTAHQKHKATWFVHDFRVLTLMRAENHSYLTGCSWLSSKNDAFTHNVDITYELLVHHKHEKSPSKSCLVPHPVRGTRQWGVYLFMTSEEDPVSFYSVSVYYNG